MDCKKKCKIKRVGSLRGKLEKKCKIKRVGALRGGGGGWIAKKKVQN